jgi:hypothetical protein
MGTHSCPERHSNPWSQSLYIMRSSFIRLTPWSLALPERPPVAKPLKNFPIYYGTQRFITVFTRALHWSLSRARSIQSIPSPTWSSLMLSPSHKSAFVYNTKFGSSSLKELKCRHNCRITSCNSTFCPHAAFIGVCSRFEINNVYFPTFQPTLFDCLWLSQICLEYSSLESTLTLLSISYLIQIQVLQKWNPL